MITLCSCSGSRGSLGFSSDEIEDEEDDDDDELEPELELEFVEAAIGTG